MIGRFTSTLFAGVLLLSACSDAVQPDRELDQPELDAAAAGSASSAPAVDLSSAVAVLPDGATVAPTAGEVELRLGGEPPLRLAIENCTIDTGETSDPGEGGGATTLVSIRARGLVAGGTPVVVDIGRFRTEGAATTVTDTITVVEGTGESVIRVLVAQRFEVDGVVSDGRDPDNRSSLLRLSRTGVEAHGLFAPPGNFAADGGLIEGMLAAACAGG